MKSFIRFIRRYSLAAAVSFCVAALVSAPALAQQVGGYPNAVQPLQGTERMVADQTIAGVTTTVDITPAMLQGYLFPGSGALSVSLGGTGVTSLTGIPVGNGVSPFTAAQASDVIALWSGSCSSSTYLNGAGNCVTPPGGGTVTSVGTPVSGNLTSFASSTVITPAVAANVIGLWSGTCNSSTYLRADGTCQTAGGSGGLGTVTSIAVDVTALNGLSVSGSPVTTSGTITLSGVLGVLAGGTGAANPNSALNNLLPSQAGQGGNCLVTNGTSSGWSSCGNGTVTSVALTVPSWLAVTGSPITAAGTFAITGSSQGANLVLASPSGAAGAMTPRALQLGDIPLIPLASHISGVLPVANGGTGDATLTGIAKGSGTSAFTAATSADIFGLWTGSCSSSTYLNGAGACTTPSGSGTVGTTGSPASGNLTKFSGAATITNADLTGDVSTSGTLATTINSIQGHTVSLAQALTLAGTSGLTLTTTGATNVTLPLTGVLITNSVATLSSLASIGTITTGVWHGTVVAPGFGGTGINNGSSTITLGGNVTTTGANVTLTATGPTTTYLFNSPPNIQTGTSYTTVLNDCNGTVQYNNASAGTITLAANASVACPVNSELKIVNLGTSGGLTLGIAGSDTLYLAAQGTTTPIQLAPYGIATARKVSSTAWYVSGPGISTGTTLLAYINSLGFSTGGILVGTFLNPFSTTPLDAINTSTTTYGSLTQVGAPGPNTGLLPGMVAVFAACVGNITGLTAIGGGGCNIEASNTAPNDWLSLAQGAQTAGYIVNVIWVPNNPAGSGNPWPDVITNNGNATYNQYIAWLTQLATDLKTLTKPFIFSPAGELNIPCGTPGTCLTPASHANWEAINAQSSGIPTSSQNTALFQLQVTTLKNLGVTNMLVNFETNFGELNNCYGWGGTGFVDLVSADYQPGTYNNSSDYGTLTGPGNCGAGYPFFLGSVASSSNPSSETPFTVNTYNAINQCIAQVCSGGANSPSAGLYVGTKLLFIWPQGSALNQQNGATAALSTSPFINKSSLPANFSKAGGIAGGDPHISWVLGMPMLRRRFPRYAANDEDCDARLTA